MLFEPFCPVDTVFIAFYRYIYPAYCICVYKQINKYIVLNSWVVNTANVRICVDYELLYPGLMSRRSSLLQHPSLFCLSILL